MQIHRYMNTQELVSFEQLRQCDFYSQQYQMYTAFCANTLIIFCLYSEIASYSKSQRDALFLNFIIVKNSTCFGQIYCPSSGVLILYSQQLVFVILVMYVDCLLARSGWNSSILTSLADSQHNQYDKYQML